MTSRSRSTHTFRIEGELKVIIDEGKDELMTIYENDEPVSAERYREDIDALTPAIEELRTALAIDQEEK